MASYIASCNLNMTGTVSSFIDAGQGTKYIRVTSGTNCERITSKTECEAAARQLGLSDTVADKEYVYDWPPYCYFYNGEQLWFNSNGNSASECSSPRRVCICKETSGK